jgi:hypothetical protein
VNADPGEKVNADPSEHVNADIGVGDRERGSVGLFLAITMVGVLAMLGLVVDGGAALAARQRAYDLAEQAARAGADALAGVSLRIGAPVDLGADPSRARAAAEAVLSAGGATGEVEIGTGEVRVTARVARRAAVLSAFGIGDLSQTATATATPLHGTNTTGS